MISRRLLSLVPHLVLLAVLFAPAGPVSAEDEDTPSALPRYVSLRAGEVNMRVGPGDNFPIEWVYRRRGLPILVTAEQGHWRRVRDWQGVEGWMHTSMLSRKRSVVVTAAMAALHTNADPASATEAELEAGVIARILECPAAGAWCRIEVDSSRGWIRRVEIWGVKPDEGVD